MTKKRLILLALLIGMLVAGAKKGRARQASEWQGLTESEARDKLETKLPAKIPAEKRSEISDKVVGKMRERGVLNEDAAVPDDARDLTDDAEQLTEH